MTQLILPYARPYWLEAGVRSVGASFEGGDGEGHVHGMVLAPEPSFALIDSVNFPAFGTEDEILSKVANSWYRLTPGPVYYPTLPYQALVKDLEKTARSNDWYKRLSDLANKAKAQGKQNFLHMYGEWFDLLKRVAPDWQDEKGLYGKLLLDLETAEFRLVARRVVESYENVQVTGFLK